MMYNDKVMNIFANPKRSGKIIKADAMGEVGNMSCGDQMRIYLKVGIGEVIEDAKFQTFGCAAAIASTNTICDMIIGKTLEEAGKIKNSEVVKQLGELPPQKIHCSVMAEQAIAAAIKDYRKRQEKEGK